MVLVPTTLDGNGASFLVRPYDYLSNYLQTQHYQYYWQNDFDATNNQININNPYPNNIKVKLTVYWRYNNAGQQYTGAQYDLPHYTFTPYDIDNVDFYPWLANYTGTEIDLVGGAFQFEDNYFSQNMDQEIGTVIGEGFTQDTIDMTKRYSPMSQYLMDYPTLPEMSETSRFLTDASRIQYIQADENYVLFYLNGQTADRQVIEADYMVVEFYNSSNTRVDILTQEINKAGTAYASPVDYTDTLRVWNLPCGPSDIDNIFGAKDWSNIAYYRVQLFYSFPTNSSSRQSVGPVGPVSEAFYFYLYTNCRPENTRVCFLNARGGYDYFTFVAYRQDTKKIKSVSYDNRYYSPGVSSPDRNIGRSVKTFATDVDQEIVLESDYLTLETSHQLEQMFYSPQVYIMQKDYISPIDRSDKVYKDLTPVQVLSTQVDTFTKKHQKLNKYKITVKTGNTFFVNKGF
jgi:hypothetical protein